MRNLPTLQDLLLLECPRGSLIICMDAVAGIPLVSARTAITTTVQALIRLATLQDTVVGANMYLLDHQHD